MSKPNKPLRPFRFLLYVADSTQNSVQAIANLKAICAAHLPGRHDIEIVDVLKEPERALADRIFMTPMLVRLDPEPECRIVGTLNQQAEVLLALGLGTNVA